MNQKKVRGFNTERLYWRIEEKSPKLYRLKSDPSLAFVNPLFYPEELFFKKDISKVGTEYFIETTGVLFKDYSKEDDASKDNQFYFNFYGNFLKQLRVISKQFSISSSYVGVSFEKKEQKLVKSEHIKSGYKMFMREYRHKTMLTWKNVIQADKALKNKIEVPIYTEILVDALNGLATHEYRKTILYSTIAIESMLAIEFDKNYEIIKSKESKNHRFVNRNNQIKDPVYEKLKKITSIRVLLHERALYTINKSLLIDDETLYQSILKLYTTRNKIVHRGEPELNSNVNNHLSIDQSGAEEAFQIAKKVFEWMNIFDFSSINLKGFSDLG